MGASTRIAWTDKTFNIAWGCQKVSPGCKNCYAERVSKKYHGAKWWHPTGDRRTFGDKHWCEPLAWDARAEKRGESIRVFACSMCDVFEDHPIIARERERLWELIRRTPHLDWQILTKRAQRIAQCLPSDWGIGWPNVWLGVSVENQEYISRVAQLRDTPAHVRFVSYEPMLGPINLEYIKWINMHWVIAGGESGPNYRSDNPEWAREVARWCVEKGVAFFYKQAAGPHSGRVPDSMADLPQDFPLPRRVFAHERHALNTDAQADAQAELFPAPMRIEP